MKKKLVSILLMIILSVSMTCASFATSINDLQNQKDEAQNQKDEAAQQLENIKTQKNNAMNEIEELSSKINQNEDKLVELRKEVEELEANIKKNEQELRNAEEKYNKNKDLLDKRLIAIHEAGETSFLDVVLNSKSISDFISKCFSVQELAEHDTELLDSIEQEKNKIQTQKEELNTQKVKVKSKKAEQEKANTVLKNAKAQKNSKIAKLSDEEKSLQEQIENYDNEMRNLIAQIQNSQQSSGSNNVNYNGVMAWPVPSSSKITSYFGYRIHPIYGVNKLHTGIDIGGADWGAPFVAADSGTVILATYNGGYGNCVIIDHGGGISTLYGHGTNILVSKGQTVSKGQAVLTVGSTGVSTGKHAHFEVRVRGVPVDPLPYIT